MRVGEISRIRLKYDWAFERYLEAVLAGNKYESEPLGKLLGIIPSEDKWPVVYTYRGIPIELLDA